MQARKRMLASKRKSITLIRALLISRNFETKSGFPATSRIPGPLSASSLASVMPRWLITAAWLDTKGKALLPSVRPVNGKEDR